MRNVLVISGPTASGKTELSEKIAQNFPAEIINADVGQFYVPLSIGTAKLDWKNSRFPQHLFDVLDEPKDLTVFEYYKFVLDKVKNIWEKEKLPIIVGGSLFYIKSLYFPMQKLEGKKTGPRIDVPDKNLWQILYDIDLKRAKALHPNDIYRIKRALEIWKKTGTKPSEYKPKFNPEFNSLFVFINPEKNILHERINKRTEIMLGQGWIEETKKIAGTEWEDFIKNKGLIGYPEIFEWIKQGERLQDLPILIENIQIRTRQYAKKQLTFWKSLKKQLLKDSRESDILCKILEIDSSCEDILDLIVQNLKEAIS